MSDVELNIAFDEDDTPAEVAEVAAPVVEVPVVVDPPEVSDAPEGEQVPAAKIEFTPEQQAYINTNIVGEKVAKQREAEESLQKEVFAREAAEAQLRKMQEPERPEIPAVPDQFDDDFEDKLQAYNEAVADQVRYDTQVQLANQNADYQRQQAANAEQVAQGEQLKTYFTRGDAIGMTEGQLKSAGDKVLSYGLTAPVVGYLIEDDNGPAITAYLAENPIEVDAINKLSPLRASAYIASNVTAKATAATKPVKAPPAPQSRPSGKSVGEGTRGPKGATFE